MLCVCLFLLTVLGCRGCELCDNVCWIMCALMSLCCVCDFFVRYGMVCYCVFWCVVCLCAFFLMCVKVLFVMYCGCCMFFGCVGVFV